MQIGGRSKGGHIYMCMHIRELCHIKGGKRGGSAKNVLHRGEGQENLNMPSLHLHQPPPLPLLNNDRSLKTNLKNSSDCLFGPAIGQWHRSPRVSGFQIGSVELMGLSGLSKWWAVKARYQTNSRIGEKQGYLQKKLWKSKTQDYRDDGKVIHFSPQSTAVHIFQSVCL